MLFIDDIGEVVAFRDNREQCPQIQQNEKLCCDCETPIDYGNSAFCIDAGYSKRTSQEWMYMYWVH